MVAVVTVLPKDHCLTAQGVEADLSSGAGLRGGDDQGHGRLCELKSV